MKYFRAPELAFWTAVVVALIALTVFAATRGGDPAPGGEPTIGVSAPGPQNSEAGAQVNALLSLMPAGISAGTDPASLTNFANSVAAQAQAGAAIRTGEGAGESDRMLAGFTRTAQDAAKLVKNAGDPVAATALRTRISLDVEHLKSLVAGLPVPDLPATGLDPLSGSSSLDAPDPAAPATPRLNSPEGASK